MQTLGDNSPSNIFIHPPSLTSRALTGGSGQQCCYNGDFLVTGQPGGGTVDLVSPDVDFIGHVVNDVIPYLLCCKAGVFSNCGEYYKNRPSDRGIDFSPPPRPGMRTMASAAPPHPHPLTHTEHRPGP